LESSVRGNVPALFGGEELVFFGNEDLAPYPTGPALLDDNYLTASTNSYEEFSHGVCVYQQQRRGALLEVMGEVRAGHYRLSGHVMRGVIVSTQSNL